MNLLHIDSSVLGQGSASRELTAAAVARLRARHPGLNVTRLDLDAEPLPHLGSGSLAGADPAEAARAKRVLEDFLAADVLVIGAPMYNFSIPSTLKAWIDRIAVAGTTFRYTAEGPVGLAGGKRVILAITQGGVHPAGSATDFQEAYLRQALGFLGITDIEVVRADGLALSPERRREALDQALGALPALAEAA